MSTLHYQSAGNVRKRAHNINKKLISDDEINGIIDRWSVNAHVMAGRAVSSPWVDGTDDIYEVVRTYVLNSAACEVLAGVNQTDEKCEKEAAKAEELIKGGGGDTAVVTAHFDLVEGLDESHYGQQF